MTWSILVGLVFTWAAAPVCLFLAAARAGGATDDEGWVLFGLCWGLAPALISRIVTWTLYLVPGAADALYLTVVVAAFAGLGLYGGGQAVLFRSMPADAAHWWRRWRWTLLAAAGIAATLVAGVLFDGTGSALAQSYSRVLGGWNPNRTGLTAVMPGFAAAILGVFAVMAGVAASAARDAVRHQVRSRIAVALIAGALGALLVLALGLIIGRPLYENDALQYFQVATLLYQQHSLAHYPMMPAAPDGTYASSAHPLGQYGLLIWGYLIAGGPVPGPGKLLVFGAGVASLVGIAVALRRCGAVAIAAAMLLLATTPGYVAQLLGCGIDPPRLALVLLAVLAIDWAFRRNSYGAWGCAGVAVGLALNSHSESLLPVAVMAASLAILPADFGWRRRLAALAIVAGASLAVGGERFALNLVAFGWPVNNELVIWRLVPSLQYRVWRSSVVPAHGWTGLLLKGPLLGFASWQWFAFTWWLAALSLLLYRRALLGDGGLRALTVTGLGTFALLAVYLGLPRSGELLIGNYRYLLCLQPVVVILAGLLVGKVVEPHASPA